MGSLIELNDTLQITTEQGFPTSELDLERHLCDPFTAEAFSGREFGFVGKPNMRIYHPAPVRVFLVHNVGGRWLHWGKVHIVEQTIDARTQMTSGKFVIIRIYPPEFMRLKNIEDVDETKRFWDDVVEEKYRQIVLQG